MRLLLRSYALGRAGFGVALLAVPGAAGRALSGEGGATPDAQAFVRGIGARDLGLGLGLLAATRAGTSAQPWLAASVLADAGDLVGIAGAWRSLPPDKRVPGAVLAGAAAATGLALLRAR